MAPGDHGGDARGRAPDCHCFGQLHSGPAGVRAIARNAVLAAVAAFVIAAGWNDPGASATGWVGRLSGTELAFLLSGSVAALIVAVIGIFVVALLRQHGRLLLRIEALERALPDQRNAVAAVPTHGHAVGLPIGIRAPPFSLQTMNGGSTPLSGPGATRAPVLLVFTDPGCGPCTALLPEIESWRRQHAELLTIALVGGTWRSPMRMESAGRQRRCSLTPTAESRARLRLERPPSGALFPRRRI